MGLRGGQRHHRSDQCDDADGDHADARSRACASTPPTRRRSPTTGRSVASRRDIPAVMPTTSDWCANTMPTTPRHRRGSSSQVSRIAIQRCRPTVLLRRPRPATSPRAPCSASPNAQARGPGGGSVNPTKDDDVATIRVRSQRPLGIATPQTTESALTPTLPGHRRWGSARAAIVARTVRCRRGGGGAVAAASFGPLAGVTAAGAVLVTGAGLLASAAATESRRLAEAPNALEQLAAVVADALKAAGGAESGSAALTDHPRRRRLDPVRTRRRAHRTGAAVLRRLSTSCWRR